MERPWKFDPAPRYRDGVMFVTKKCVVCFRKIRWAEDACFECLGEVNRLAEKSADKDEADGVH